MKSLSDYDDSPVFDPFKTPWVILSWHSRIVQIPAPATSRFYGVELTGGPCCLWNGWSNHTDPDKAYGCIRIGGVKFLLHRYAFACHHGIELSPEDVVDHLCRRRRCFNPHHHECTTPLENWRRGDGPLYRFRSIHERASEHMESLPF